MDSADPQNRSEWRGCLRKNYQKAKPSVEENGLLNGYDAHAHLVLPHVKVGCKDWGLNYMEA